MWFWVQDGQKRNLYGIWKAKWKQHPLTHKSFCDQMQGQTEAQVLGSSQVVFAFLSPMPTSFFQLLDLLTANSDPPPDVWLWTYKGGRSTEATASYRHHLQPTFHSHTHLDVPGCSDQLVTPDSPTLLMDLPELLPMVWIQIRDPVTLQHCLADWTMTITGTQKKINVSKEESLKKWNLEFVLSSD